MLGHPLISDTRAAQIRLSWATWLLSSIKSDVPSKPLWEVDSLSFCSPMVIRSCSETLYSLLGLNSLTLTRKNQNQRQVVCWRLAKACSGKLRVTAKLLVSIQLESRKTTPAWLFWSASLVASSLRELTLATSSREQSSFAACRTPRVNQRRCKRRLLSTMNEVLQASKVATTTKTCV